MEHLWIGVGVAMRHTGGGTQHQFRLYWARAADGETAVAIIRGLAREEWALDPRWSVDVVVALVPDDEVRKVATSLLFGGGDGSNPGGPAAAE